MDDERVPKTYTCPICSEEKPSIYSYPTGGKLKITETIYFTGMCGECLQRENPFYMNEMRKAESEARSWKTMQARKGRSGY